jgi:uncharacterized protein YhfF
MVPSEQVTYNRCRDQEQASARDCALRRAWSRIDTLVDNDLSNEPHVRQFWNSYTRATHTKTAEFNVFGFGDGPELADELVALVLSGVKRARTSLPSDFVAQGRPLPKPGDFSIIVDGMRTPRCIVRTVQVDVKPMRDVDAQFAWDAGGGDRTLAWWMSAHMRYFKRQGARDGFAVDADTQVVLERFEVVWPREVADIKKVRGALKGQPGPSSGKRSSRGDS